MKPKHQDLFGLLCVLGALIGLSGSLGAYDKLFQGITLLSFIGLAWVSRRTT